MHRLTGIPSLVTVTLLVVTNNQLVRQTALLAVAGLDLTAPGVTGTAASLPIRTGLTVWL